MTYNVFYKITNNVNGKFYYGVHRTKNLNDNYLGSGSKIKYAIKKYGKENFTKENLFLFDTYKEALDYESLVVDEILVTDRLCYNVKKGGIGGSQKGRISNRRGVLLSDKTKKKQSISRISFCKDNPMSEETKSKISKANKRSILQFDKQMNFIKEWPGRIDFEREFSIKAPHISDCFRGRQQSAYGFVWKCKE